MTLRVGDQAEDVRIWQEKLIEGGYLPPGSADGVFGPETEAATREFQSAHGLTVDGVVGAETWGNMMGDPRYPNNSTGALTPKASGGGGSSAVDAKVREMFPRQAYLLDADPEVAQILRDAANANPPWAPDLLEAKLMQTGWFKGNSDRARDYYNLQATDPATFQREIWEMEDQVLNIAGQIGYDESIMTPEYVSYFAHRAKKEGLTPSQLRALMTAEITPLAGTTEKSPFLHQMRQIQQAYQIAIDQPTQQYWLKQLGSGKMTIENFEGAIIAQAKALFPNLTGQFESGMTLKQIIDPYRRQIAAMLELDTESIDFVGNPKWRHVIDYVDPKDGTHRSMSNQELARYVRSMDEYWQTRNGKDEAGELTEEILTSFGAVRR